MRSHKKRGVHLAGRQLIGKLCLHVVPRDGFLQMAQHGVDGDREGWHGCDGRVEAASEGYKGACAKASTPEKTASIRERVRRDVEKIGEGKTGVD